MIITPVQRVKSCKMCPNLRPKPKGVGIMNWLCLAIMKIIGSDDSPRSILNLNNKVSDLCPFRNDEVNRRPKRN